MGVPLLVCVGALIVDDAGRLFLQRRSPDRTLFANCWDIVGGHVEPGETLEQALVREVEEETGWRVTRIGAGFAPLEWTGDDGRDRVEYDFVVSVAGDLSAPRLEVGKQTEFRWVPESGLDILREHRSPGNDLTYWIASLAFAARGAAALATGDAEYGARIGARMEAAFVGAMRRIPRLAGGTEGVRAHGGPPAVGALIEFRTALARPGRWITEPEALAVVRYRDADEFRAGLRSAAGVGTLEIDASGAFRATAAGHTFLRWLYAQQAAALAQLWTGALAEGVDTAARLLAPVLVAARESGGPAWRAMTPVHEPDAAPAALLLLNRMGALRYHRADAHAQAWRTAGRTAAEMPDLPPGAEREAIEERTDAWAAAPYAVLTDADRAALLDALPVLPEPR